MQLTPEISFRGVSKTPAVVELIQREMDKLDRFASNIIGCRVAVEQPHQHTRSGNPYRVRIELTMPPGKNLVVSKEPEDNDLHDTLPTVLRRAFAAMERQVRDAARQRRGDVKSREEPLALVAQLFPEQEYGFIRTPQGREIYFHRNAVLNDDFERLATGTEVRFTESMGEKGPQASTVQIVNKPGERETSQQESQARTSE